MELIGQEGYKYVIEFDAVKEMVEEEAAGKQSGLGGAEEERVG
jgi:hypothetical protein